MDHFYINLYAIAMFHFDYLNFLLPMMYPKMTAEISL